MVDLGRGLVGVVQEVSTGVVDERVLVLAFVRENAYVGKSAVLCCVAFVGVVLFGGGGHIDVAVGLNDFVDVHGQGKLKIVGGGDGGLAGGGDRRSGIDVTDLGDVLNVFCAGDVELLAIHEIDVLRDGGGDFSVRGVDVAGDCENAAGGNAHGTGDVVADIQVFGDQRVGSGGQIVFGQGR